MRIRGIKSIMAYHYAVITLLPFLVITLLSFTVIFPREKAEAEGKHRQIAAALDDKIETFLKDQTEILAHVVLHHEINSVLQLELDRIVDASVALNVLSYVSTDGTVEKVGLSFNHENKLHADFEGMDLSGSDIFKKVSTLHKPVWSEAFLSIISGGPAIAYALPAEEGYLIGEVSLVELGNYLRRISLPDNNLVFITDHKGQLIVEKHKQLDSVKTNLGDLQLFKDASRQHSVTAIFTIDKKDYLGTLSPLKALGWYSLLATPKEAVFHNAHNSIEIIMSGLLISLLLAAVSARQLLKKFSGQFERLARHTREVATTGYIAEKPAESILEFQQIVDSLDTMSQTIAMREESLLDALKYLQLNSTIFETLYDLSTKDGLPEKEILDFSLDAALRVTDSPIGYIYLLDATEELLTLHSWSKNVMAECSVPSPPTSYAVADTGLWGEAVRLRQAVITNDYAAESPLKKGIPEGHVRISRHMNLPVIHQGKIVLLIGVGNKLTDYFDEDTRHLRLLMDTAWLLIMKRRNLALLKESEARSLQMFQQNDDAIIFFRSAPLRPLDANPAALALFRATDGDSRRLSPRRIFCRADLHTIFAAIKDEKRDLYIEKLTCHRVDGESFSASIKANIITIDNEDVLFCSFRDISERLTLEAAVQATQARMIQTNKMTSLGLLVSSVAHEINNPNQCIGMNAFLLSRIWKECADRLEKSHGGDENFRLDGMSFRELEQTVPQMIDTMAESSRRIDSYVKELMDFVRAGKGGTSATVDVNKIITSAVSILWYQIRSNTTHFSTQLSDRNPLVHGNAQQLEQVIINMIANALQSLTSQSAAVSVTTGLSADDKEVLITIRDEGKGMDKATLAKLAEPFFSTRQEKGGTGLGVYISANIIKESKGSITFDSEPGQGTVVTVRLPATGMNPGNETTGARGSEQP